MRKIFSPPVFPEDEEKTRTAFILNYLLLLAMVPSLLLEILFGRHPMGRHLYAAASFLVIVVMGKVLMHSGRVRAACIASLGLFWLSLTLQNLVAGGIRAPGFVNHAIILLMAGMTLGYRATILFGCLAVMTGIGFVMIEEAGMLPAAIVENTTRRHLGVYIWTFTMAAAILWTALRCLYQALDRAQKELAGRKQIEKELLQSEERFRSTFEQAAVGIAHITPDGRILRANRRFCDLFGYTQEELLHLSFREISYPEEPPEDHESMAKTFEGSIDSYSAEKRCARKDGSIVWTNLTVSPVSGPSGAPEYLVAIVEDITERKAAEARVFEYQDRLRSMAMELSRVEDEERRQITVELHDRIGQNLALANMKLTSVRDDSLPSDVRSVMDDACHTLREASVEVKSLIFEISPPELHELGLGAAVEELALHFEAKYGICAAVNDDELDGELHPEIRTALYRVVRELMINVVKHAGATRMAISLSRDDGSVRVEVADDGVGFDTVNAAQPEGKARPFGLFSVRERIEYLGGCLVVDSESGQGTRISISVPVN